MTGKICGLSRRTVYRSVISTEQSKLNWGALFDQFDVNCLSCLILSYYTQSPPVVPTLDMIDEDALTIPGFPADNVLSFAELHSVLFEVANIVNSRPIGIITGSDPTDPKPLTPLMIC